MSISLRLLCFALLASVASVAQAALTYVDATPNTNGNDGNTTLSGFLFNPETDLTQSSNGTDGKWAYRAVTTTNATNGPGFFESDTSATDGETTLPLVTTLTGLTPGQLYNIYVVYWGDFAQYSTPPNWDIAARAGETGPFTLFKTTGALPVDTSGYIDGGIGTLASENGSEFTNSPMQTRAGVTPPNLHLFYASLGTFMIDGSGSFSVWIDGPDVDNGANGSKRTWYDGLAFEAVPEPSSILLLAIGTAGLLTSLGRRNRK
jgi:hypothetical protein